MTGLVRSNTDTEENAVPNPMKDWITREVASAADMFQYRGIPDDDVTEVTVTHPTKMESQLRVKTKTQGVRYFTIKVTENI